MAALAASALPLPQLAHASADDEARLWLNRLTFGASSRDLRAFADLGPKAWLDRQLSLPETDPNLDRRLSSARLRISYAAGE